MRVANKAVYDITKYNLGNLTEELGKANKVVSSGKRINSLSDDPIGMTQVLNIKSSLANIAQMERNITSAKPWLTAAESALANVQELISETRALTVQAATSTTGASERSSMASIIQGTLEEIVSMANTEVNGLYIFAGSKTDTIPFNQDGSYEGNDNAFKIKIGNDSTIETGSDGEAVFGTIFTTLSDLKTALETNDVSEIQATMSALENDFNNFSAKISDTGSRHLRLEIKENILSSMKLTNTERLSNIEDADITEAIIDLKEKELAYQAALASSSKVMQLSLVDYIR